MPDDLQLPRADPKRLPPKVVATWETPEQIGGPGAVNIEAFSSMDRLALPIPLSPDMQMELLGIFTESLAADKFAQMRKSFTMLLALVEYVEERLTLEDGSIAKLPNGEPIVSTGFLRGLGVFKDAAPSADGPPVAPGQVGG